MRWAQILSIAVKIAPMIAEMSDELRELGARKEDSDNGRKITAAEGAQIAQICAVYIGKFVDEIIDDLGLSFGDD